jgi:mRNA-decapping enzyme subunit 2
LPHFKDLKTFAIKIFSHCPLLFKIQFKFDELFTEFGNYKSEIPVCGCILLNSDLTKIALICSWTGKSWGFPRGKIDEGESSLECAIRETYEETGCSQTPWSCQ